jgi:hypothetical protein
MITRLLRWLVLAALGAGLVAAWCLAAMNAVLQWVGPPP